MDKNEALKQALEALELCNGAETVDGVVIYTDQEIAAIKEAIAELEGQEPVAWLLTEKNINSLQVDSIQLLINRLKHAHHTDLCVRINGQDEWFQADWLKHMVRATPPQRTWVGLTPEEFHEACWESYVDPVTGECSTGDREYAVSWTEAKLKEKNT
jgi:hypothetical protein